MSTVRQCAQCSPPTFMPRNNKPNLHPNSETFGATAFGLVFHLTMSRNKWSLEVSSACSCGPFHLTSNISIMSVPYSITLPSPPVSNYAYLTVTTVVDSAWWTGTANVVLGLVHIHVHKKASTVPLQTAISNGELAANLSQHSVSVRQITHNSTILLTVCISGYAIHVLVAAVLPIFRCEFHGFALIDGCISGYRHQSC